MASTNGSSLHAPSRPSWTRAAADCGQGSQFRELVYRLRVEAGLTQAVLAERMGISRSAIVRMEGGGTKPTLELLQRLAGALGQELVIGIGPELSEHQSMAKLVRDGHAVIHRVD